MFEMVLAVGGDLIKSAKRAALLLFSERLTLDIPYEDLLSFIVVQHKEIVTALCEHFDVRVRPRASREELAEKLIDAIRTRNESESKSKFNSSSKSSRCPTSPSSSDRGGDLEASEKKHNRPNSKEKTPARRPVKVSVTVE